MHHGRCCWDNPGRVDEVHNQVLRCRLHTPEGEHILTNQVISAIEKSESWEVILVMGLTMDYLPLVVALCAAKTAAPERLVEIILDREQTLYGPANYCMTRDLLEAGVRVRLAGSNRPTP